MNGLTDQVEELAIEDAANSTPRPDMRVVMIQTAMGLKPPSGGFRGNYATIYALQRHGHETMQFAWAHVTDIDIAIAELKAKGMWNGKNIETGTTMVLNENSEELPCTWWIFNNTHGVRCVCLDADVMRYAYNNYLQQLDAAKWIEVMKTSSQH